MLRRVEEPGGTKCTDHWRIGVLAYWRIGLLAIGILNIDALTIARMTASDSIWMRLWPNNRVYGLIMVLLTREGVVLRSLS